MPAPLPHDLAELLAARARSDPRALAFATAERSLSYEELAREAERLAGGLAAAGVEQGARIALVLPAGLDFVRGFFAVQRLTAVPCAFDPGAPPATAMRRVARLRPSLALVGGPASNELAEAGEALGIRCLALDELARGAAEPGPAVAGEDDVALLQPTSGTSGEPRFAAISHRNALASLTAAREVLAIRPEDVLVSWVPPWHDLGLLRFVLGAVYFGTPCHLVPPAIRTLPLWLETLAEVGGTITGAPDFAYRLAVRLAPAGDLELPSLRFATNGGEPVRRSSIEAFERRFGAVDAVRPGYGLAEATLGVSCLRPGEPLRVDARGNVSCGRPFPGVEVRIDQPAEGGVGEILVRGPSVFAGYLDDPQLSAEVLRGGWLHTGDLGAIDGDDHLYVLGRQRTLLKRGGAPLAPRELEEAAEGLPGVRAVAAVGVAARDGSASERIVLVLEVGEGCLDRGAALAAEAAAAVRAATGFAPEQVTIVAPRSLPRTTNGKTRHAELRSLMESGELERRGSVLLSVSPDPA